MSSLLNKLLLMKPLWSCLWLYELDDGYDLVFTCLIFMSVKMLQPKITRIVFY